jgi:hypothetical protein
MIRNLLQAALLGCVVLSSFGQDYRASMLGTVTDPSKAPIPSATVKATKEDTNVSRETQTNSAGLYTYEYRVLPNRFHSIRGHTAPQFDLTLSKKVNVGERYQVEFRAEAFNAFNTPLRGDPPSGDPQSANFGILPVAQLNFPRNVQLGLRLRF